jgi:hypothetical protein
MPNLESSFAALTRTRDDVVFMRPCLDLTCYWRGSAFEHAQGILRFHQRCIDLIGARLTSYKTETMASPKPLKKDSLELVPFWFTGTRSRRDIYMLYLESSAFIANVSDGAFALHAIEAEDESLGYARIVVPPEAALSHPERFVQLALDLVAELRFDFGHGGFGLNWLAAPRFDDDVRTVLGNLRTRYAGLDLSDPGSTKYCAGSGIKCANWLTLLSTEQVESLGGVEAIAQTVGKEVTLHPLPHGLLIQAGPQPELGDVNRREALLLYRRVGRLVAPLRSEIHPPFLKVDGVVSEGDTDEWLARFDD